jgi:hypothetical protein
LLLPLYVKARAKNHDFSLDLQIFSADSLEKPNPQRAQSDFFDLLNARVQLSRERRQTCSKAEVLLGFPQQRVRSTAVDLRTSPHAERVLRCHRSVPARNSHPAAVEQKDYNNRVGAGERAHRRNRRSRN